MRGDVMEQTLAGLVSETRRVVRASSWSRSLSSRPRLVWLSAWRDTEFGRRSREATLPRHGEEGSQIVDVISGHY
jgi:hypothetical protein